MGSNILFKTISLSKRKRGDKCKNGVNVFSGKFSEFKVLVERRKKPTISDKILLESYQSKNHNNIRRIFRVEEPNPTFFHIAVEDYRITFNQYFENKNHKVRDQIKVRQILRDAAKAVQYLHSCGIVHGQLRPDNIYVCKVSAKISCIDIFERSKDYLPPEILNGEGTSTGSAEITSKFVDTFSLGCVFFYGVNDGHHLFGNLEEDRIENTKEYMPGFNSSSKYINVTADGLIQEMVSRQRSSRPSLDKIIRHPLLWKQHTVYDFLHKARDCVIKMSFEQIRRSRFEQNFKLVVKNDWKSHLDEPLKSEASKDDTNRNYCVIDLLTFMCNQVLYYEDKHLTQVEGHVEAWQHLDYWLNLFPHLLQHIYHSCEPFKKDERFRRFYMWNETFKPPDYFKSPEMEPKPLKSSGDDLFIDENSLKFNRDDVIGKTDKTEVFGGFFKELGKEKPLAIKMQAETNFRRVEISNLKKVQDCQHIIKFFGVFEKLENNQIFYGIVLERAFCSLKQYVESETIPNIYEKFSAAREKLSKIKILHNVTSGVCHLHKSKIVHRDLKPENVLIILNENARAVLADFGSSKDNEGKAAFTMTSSLSGSHGWMAPEIYSALFDRTNAKIEISDKSDIFPLALIYYFTLNAGEHLYGNEKQHRQSKIAKSNPVWKGCQISDSALIQLIKDMVKKQPSKRPPAQAILQHLYFWDIHKILGFIRRAVKLIEGLNSESRERKKICKPLESEPKKVFRGNWYNELPSELKQNLENHMPPSVKIDGTSILCLLQAAAHQNEGNAEEFWAHWSTRFKDLLWYAYFALRTVPELSEFYTKSIFVFTKPSKGIKRGRD